MASAFDVVILGSGPAGEKAAIQAAKLGRRVAVVERAGQLGGNCLHTATIPSKTLREGILAVQRAREQAPLGVRAAFGKDLTLSTLTRRTSSVIHSQEEVVDRHLSRNDVAVFQGVGRFVDPHTIEVCDGDGARRELRGDLIVIATGSRPAHDPSIPFDRVHVFDSDTILGISALPGRLTIVGGGVIGCEYACMFNALGTKVTLLDTRPRVLDCVDQEIAELFVARMRDKGVTLRLGEAVTGVQVDDRRRVLATTQSGKVIAGDMLLYAVGREGNTADLQLERAGLRAGRRGILEVNSNFQTSVPHIYAVGDVIGFPSLAATSMHQGRIAMAHALGVPIRSEGAFLPFGIYTIPEISMAGETEEQLTAARVPYEGGHAFYREIARGEISGERTGMLKLLFERDTHRLRGVHIIGAYATELVHIGQAVLSFGGPVDYFVDNVFNYPTLSETYRVAALNGLNRL
jgi:NAD(P) transhydrogenase